MAEPLRPSEVFTPNRSPLDEHNVYAAREEAEANLRLAVERSETAVVYGEYGVGKTTLVQKFFQDADQDGRVVEIRSPAGKNMDDVAKVMLERLGYAVEVSRTASSGSEIQAEVESGWAGILKARLAGKLQQGTTTTQELEVKSPTEEKLLELMSEHALVLVIDEMHKASDGFRIGLAEMIKAVSGIRGTRPIIVVLGTTTDAGKLVEQDEGIDRLLREVRVQPMSPAEASFVVREGMSRLDLEISDEIVGHIVATAAGAPALVQEMCLDLAEAVLKEGRSSIELNDLQSAVTAFLGRSQARLTETYNKAIETTGPRRYRRQILRAVAESDSEFVTMEELVERVSAQVGEPVPAESLSGPLRQLKEPEYGSILTDVKRPSTDARVWNLTSFKDARMKAFVRMVVAAEHQGLVSSTQLRALPKGDG